jgi:DtxR family manganese transport transcriptional regulator
VSQATVSKIISRLQKQGLVTSQLYRSLFLTSEGAALAKSCKERLILVVQFLKSPGLSEEIAEMDAEVLEHHVNSGPFSSFVSI